MGIPIGLDYSWFLIVALFSWSLATGYYPAHYPDWSVFQYWLLGSVTAIMTTIVTALARCRCNHRVIHRGVGEGAAHIIPVATVTVEFT